MKKVIILERGFGSFRNGRTDGFNFEDQLQYFNNVEDGLKALKECKPRSISERGELDIETYALTIYETDTDQIEVDDLDENDMNEFDYQYLNPDFDQRWEYVYDYDSDTFMLKKYY